MLALEGFHSCFNVSCRPHSPPPPPRCTSSNVSTLSLALPTPLKKRRFFNEKYYYKIKVKIYLRKINSHSQSLYMDYLTQLHKMNF